MVVANIEVAGGQSGAVPGLALQHIEPAMLAIRLGRRLNQGELPLFRQNNEPVAGLKHLSMAKAGPAPLAVAGTLVEAHKDAIVQPVDETIPLDGVVEFA